VEGLLGSTGLLLQARCAPQQSQHALGLQLLVAATLQEASWLAAATALLSSAEAGPTHTTQLSSRLQRALLSVRQAQTVVAAGDPAHATRVLATHRIESAHPFVFGATQTALVKLSAAPAPALVRVAFSHQCGLVCAEDSVSLQLAGADGSAVPWPVGSDAASAVQPALVGPLAGRPKTVLIRAPRAPALLVTLKTAPPSANAPTANRWGVALTITEYGSDARSPRPRKRARGSRKPSSACSQALALLPNDSRRWLAAVSGDPCVRAAGCAASQAHVGGRAVSRRRAS